MVRDANRDQTVMLGVYTSMADALIQVAIGVTTVTLIAFVLFGDFIDNRRQ